MENQNNSRYDTKENETSKVPFTPPRIVTYTREEILEQIGPAHTCVSSFCPTP